MYITQESNMFKNTRSSFENRKIFTKSLLSCFPVMLCKNKCVSKMFTSILNCQKKSSHIKICDGVQIAIRFKNGFRKHDSALR